MEIDNKTLEKGGEMLGLLMQSYRTKINQAFLKQDDKFKIGLGLTISPGLTVDSVKLEAEINFVSERIKDTFTQSVDIGPTLFDQESTVKCPVRGIPVLESVCGDCKDRQELIISEPNDAGERLNQFRSCSAWSNYDHHKWIEKQIKDCERWITENRTNECGNKISPDGICSYLWHKDPGINGGKISSQCNDLKEGRPILCCRECPEKKCSDRCEEAKGKKKRAA